MFVHIMFILMVGISSSVLAMGGGGAAAAPAKAEAMANFTLVDTPQPDPKMAVQATILSTLISARENPAYDFSTFLKKLKHDCAGWGINLKTVCKLQTPDGRSLIDHAIFAGCPVAMLAELAKHGAPVHWIDSKTPTLETAWMVDKNPDQQNIVRWLLESDPTQPVGTPLRSGGFTVAGSYPDTLLRLNLTFENPKLFYFCANLTRHLAIKNTPGLKCMCGKPLCSK